MPLPLATICVVQAARDYTLARKIDRYQAQDVMSTVFEDYIDLSGDGKVSDDFCLKGGLAKIGGKAVVVMGTIKGHTPGDMKAANFGEMGNVSRRCMGGGGRGAYLSVGCRRVIPALRISFRSRSTLK